MSVLGSIESPSAAACIAASSALESTVAYVVVAAQTTNPECTSACHKDSPKGHLADASPWILAWLITHPHLRASPHRGLEKLILSFLNSVSDEFLDLLDPILDRNLTVESHDMLFTPISHEDDYLESRPGLTSEQLVAAEIFAHWLVLLMLLENNWWIGDLGIQELMKLVGTIKGPHLSGSRSLSPNTPLDQTGSPELIDRWWPESLLSAALELKRTGSDL